MMNDDQITAIQKKMSAFDAVNAQSLSSNIQPISKTLQAINSNSVSAMQQLAKTMGKVGAATIASMHSEAMQASAILAKRFGEMIASFDFTPILKKLGEALIPLNYISLLRRVKWPVFLIDDAMLRDNIMEACSAHDDLERVKEIIFDYCTDEFLASIEGNWKNCEAIALDRKPILSEAMLMHRYGYYYASTSMLMCQIYGIASDVADIAKKNGLELSEEEKKDISEYFEIAKEDIDKEKGKLMQMTAITQSGWLLWNSIARYLKEEILCSSDSKKRWKTQPLRNKICHGDQLNYGTKEHSLKAILTIDMLVKLADAIYGVAKKKKGECVDESL